MGGSGIRGSGKGSVVLGTLTYRGAFVTFLSSLSLRHKSVGTGQERKVQVTSIPLLPASPASPQGRGAPQPLVPHYLLASQPHLPRGACSARLPLLPGLSWVTLGKGRGNSQGRVWAAGERRATACRSSPSRASQPARGMDGRMDGRAVTSPLGHSCLGGQRYPGCWRGRAGVTGTLGDPLTGEGAGP